MKAVRKSTGRRPAAARTTPIEISIIPNYAKGTPIDVANLSLDRAMALSDVLEAYHMDGEDDQHIVPIDAVTMHMLLATLRDQLEIAKQAVGYLTAKVG